MIPRVCLCNRSLRRHFHRGVELFAMTLVDDDHHVTWIVGSPPYRWRLRVTEELVESLATVFEDRAP